MLTIHSFFEINVKPAFLWETKQNLVLHNKSCRAKILLGKSRKQGIILCNCVS